MAGAIRLDFVSFRDRIQRLVESLVALRRLPASGGPWPDPAERAEVRLEADEIIITFTVARLSWDTARTVAAGLQRTFCGITPLLADTCGLKSFRFSTARQKKGAIAPLYIGQRTTLEFDRAIVGGTHTVAIRAGLSDFNDHLETFVIDTARTLFPPIEEPRARAATPVDLESWHKEFGRSFERLGCRVLRESVIGWQDLVGLDRVRERLERSVLLPLTREALYQKVASAVMPGGVNLLPRGVLLTGPPGTGKTWSMRALAGEAGLPVVVLPCEALMSKWYGESEQRLADVFRVCRQAGRLILLVDELDAIARHRGESHEATARLVSILLAELDGLSNGSAPHQVLFVGSANNVASVDTAVLGRFDLTIAFDLPDAAQRRQALAYHARQLPSEDIADLAARMDGWSFRRLARFAESVVRGYVSALDVSQLEGADPPVPRREDYLRELEDAS